MELSAMIDRSNQSEWGESDIPAGGIAGQAQVGKPPPYVGEGTPEWQRALRMGMEINARQRRN